MSVLQLCCSFISKQESFRSKPYRPTPKDRPTIGYGNTFWEDGRPVSMSDAPITQERAQQLLQHFVSKCLSTVLHAAKVPLSVNQQIALTSFEYNTGALLGHTLLKDLNAGNYAAAADQFDLWVHQGSQVLPVLVERRDVEKRLFLTPDA